MRLRFLLLLPLVLSTANAEAAGIQALRQFYSEVQAVEAKFVQTQYDDAGARLQQSRGSFQLARPLRFRWEYQEPYSQLLVCNGSKFWLYDVDLAQVTLRPAQEALRGAPMRLLSGGVDLEKEFKLEEDGRADGLDWVKLTPRDTQADFASVRMGFADKLPRELELRDNLGQLTRIRLEQAKAVRQFPASTFEFKPPPGVEVVAPEAEAPG
ncbi:MAG: outer membrane lipoprotein chaperone LolA [Nevskiales bacterium]